MGRETPVSTERDHLFSEIPTLAPILQDIALQPNTMRSAFLRTVFEEKMDASESLSN
jgi:hypothetical protein